MKKVISISFLIIILVLISGSKLTFAKDLNESETYLEEENENTSLINTERFDDDNELDDDDDNINIIRKITPKNPVTKPTLTITPTITNNNTTNNNLDNIELTPTPTVINKENVNQESSSLNSNNDLFHEFKKLLSSLQKIIFTILG